MTKYQWIWANKKNCNSHTSPAAVLDLVAFEVWHIFYNFHKPLSENSNKHVHQNYQLRLYIKIRWIQSQFQFVKWNTPLIYQFMA